ncbi:MAG: glycosyltransferase family 2 protein [Chloroherpetonaceae bacterium]|nr:glycosyltransferase family 2 protein [Chloroherpetonaceae bacterium]
MRDQLFPHVSIIILNWNNWRDTITCLSSVLQLKYPNFSIILCDNHSTDHSIDKIHDWLQGQLSFQVDFPEIDNIVVKEHKPHIPYSIENYRYEEKEFKKVSETLHRLTRLITVIDTGSNLGYGGGNNVGIRFALSRFNSTFFWILNNDTFVLPNSLNELVTYQISRPNSHLIGSLILDFENPSTVQMAGGASYLSFFGVATPSYNGFKLSTLKNLYPNGIPNHCDFISGAALFMSRELIDSVGMFEEQYFLYHEEIDLSLRGKGLFQNGFCERSIVLHKQSATIPLKGKSDLKGEYFDLRSRLLFQIKFYPQNLLVFYFFMLFLFMKNLLIFDFQRVKMIVSIMISPKKNPYSHV